MTGAENVEPAAGMPRQREGVREFVESILSRIEWNVEARTAVLRAHDPQVDYDRTFRSTKALCFFLHDEVEEQWIPYSYDPEYKGLPDWAKEGIADALAPYTSRYPGWWHWL